MAAGFDRRGILMTNDVLEKQAEPDDKPSSNVKASRMPTFKILMIILLAYILNVKRDRLYILLGPGF